MADLLTGWVRGNTITLDTSLPPLEGKRVLVRIERAEDTETAEIAADHQALFWREWAERGPQGPIEDEGESDFP
jgi:hypothetical protein